MEYFEDIQLLDNKLIINGDVYSYLSKIGEGKSAISLLYENHNHKKVTLKNYIQTEQNAIPLTEAVNFEILSHERMAVAGISIPKLIGFNKEKLLLVKEYIDGPVMIDYVAQGKITDQILQKMFDLHYKLKRAGFHVDFYPANFIICNDRMYCIDYEAHEYNSEWDFINWGIFYWLNTNGIKEFLVTKNPDLINKPGTYKPYDAAFLEERNRLVTKFSYLENELQN
ncbi:MAG: hypothetical protein BKP49_08010 [Treponema sp. CETP13]|nr:MAG: hypothetical protein BKP49_08010 [Treponema sp. CETP13]